MALAILREMSKRLVQKYIRYNVPDVPIQVFNRLAGVDVNELAVYDNRDTCLGLSDVGTDELAADIY